MVGAGLAALAAAWLLGRPHSATLFERQAQLRFHCGQSGAFLHFCIGWCSGRRAAAGGRAFARVFRCLKAACVQPWKWLPGWVWSGCSRARRASRRQGARLRDHCACGLFAAQRLLQRRPAQASRSVAVVFIHQRCSRETVQQLLQLMSRFLTGIMPR